MWNVLRFTTFFFIESLKCNSEDKCRNIDEFESDGTEPEILCKDMGDLRVYHGRDNDIWYRCDIYSVRTPDACCRCKSANFCICNFRS